MDSSQLGDLKVMKLTQVVEADDADIGSRVLLDVLHLLKHLLGVGAPEDR